MKKILSFILLLGLFSTIVSPLYALMAPAEDRASPSNMVLSSEKAMMPLPPIKKNNSDIEYPKGDDFIKLKQLIEVNFSKSENQYKYNCIANGSLCPNYKYTSITEKAIKFIVLKTYLGNEEFYNTLFINTQSYSDISDKKNIQRVLKSIPFGSNVPDWKTFGFGNSIGSDLLEASFGVNFSENTPSGMLGVIDQKIKELKRNNCLKKETINSICYTDTISNLYLPTLEELNKETIYLNRNFVNIKTLKDEFEYITKGLEAAKSIADEFVMTSAGQKGTLPCILEDATDKDCIDVLGALKELETKALIPYLLKNKKYPNTLDQIVTDVPNKLLKIISTNFSYKRISELGNEDYEIRYIGHGSMPYVGTIVAQSQGDINLKKDNSISSKKSVSFEEPTYILRYKKNTYTLEEAKKEIEKQDSSAEEFLVKSTIQQGELPCKTSTEYLVRSQCTAALSGLLEVQTALAAYQVDTADFPTTVDKLNQYLAKFPQSFKDNFSYKFIKNEGTSSDYEIRYIGHIGEGNTQVENKKDYKAMMSGSILPEIPAIFSHVPADSMVLYIKNPENLLDILNQKSNTSNRISGIDISESIKGFVKTFFEINEFDQIEKNLKNEMAIVVNNLDATAPDIIFILSESDREALAPTAKARVVGSKDGFIFIASSKESLEYVMNLSSSKSLKEAPDFHYVWWKKSGIIKDAFVFVGDLFFEKIISFETYLVHYRKYRDYSRLGMLQELLWSYEDAFGKSVSDLSELNTYGISTLTGEVLSEYAIIDGLVTHNNVGTLKSVKTLPEAHYDLSKISRKEVEDYKYNVLKYREIWQASLDPMGIVLNRYGDGMEIDFFMTPIPASSDRDLQEIQNIFEGVTKDSLDFVSNSKIRMGLISFVFGFDPKKFQEKIQSNKEIGNDFSSFSKQIIDGKNIFDYLGGEFAFSIGSLDPDIFEGWNVDKVDMYASVEVVNEEKGKELIELLKKRILGTLSPDESEDSAPIIKMFMKPLIEDYKEKKIYYVEAIPVPFFGKMGMAYTFVDNFFVVGLNRSTIRNVIDASLSGDERKESITNNESLASGTFFATLFDGVNFSKELKNLYEKNESTLSRNLGSDIADNFDYVPLVSAYYSSEDRNRRLEQKGIPFHYSFGAITLDGKDGNIMITLDEKQLSNLSGTVLQNWENLKKDPLFPQAVLTEKGVPLETFLSLKNLKDFVGLNTIIQLENALNGSESLLRNVTFGMNIGNDEIGFKLRIFRENGIMATIHQSVPVSSDIWIIGGMVIMIIFLGVLVIIVQRKSENLPIETTTENIPENPISSEIPQDIPNDLQSKDISSFENMPKSENILIEGTENTTPDSSLEK
ncbi:hypothetical protein HOO68_00295 [Candidatus Gracilibacteria bacterium]|nr:hypothetical protein [Candidatus Gracilibacteria bacterium]